MKKFVFMVLGVTLAFYLAGCGKKQEALEEMQEPVSLETLSKLSSEAAVAETKVPPALAQAPVTTETLPAAQQPAKPTNQEIQTALKNAGFYTGEIDGKIGPLTRRAIEEFQKANNLKVDGKVGQKTWAVLSSHLNPPAAPAKKRR